MKFADLQEKAQRQTQKAFKHGIKRFSVRLEVSPNAKTPKLEKAFSRDVFRAFLKVHDRGCIATAVKLEIVLRSRDTLFDLGSFEVHRHGFRRALEEMGMKQPGMTILHIKSEAPCIEVNGEFRDVSPLDLYRTEDGGRL